jgi:hypothetical protein
LRTVEMRFSRRRTVRDLEVMLTVVTVVVVVERDTEVTVRVVVEQVGDALETVVVTAVGKPVAKQLPVTVGVTVTVGMDPPVEIVGDVFDEADEVDAIQKQATLTFGGEFLH